LPLFLTPGQSYAWAVSYNGFLGEVRTFSMKPPVIKSFSPNRGPVGTIVKIIGTGLGGPSEALIGSKTAMLLTSSNTFITAKVLPANVTGSVKVRVPGGAIARASGMFTITDTTRLTAPENMAMLDAGVQPTFNWSVPVSPTGGGSFKIRIVELKATNPPTLLYAPISQYLKRTACPICQF
jgi:hypothetical protein